MSMGDSFVQLLMLRRCRFIYQSVSFPIHAISIVPRSLISSLDFHIVEDYCAC